MKDLEDAHCEVRKIVELQLSNWNHLNSPLDDDARSLAGSPASNGSSNFLGGFLEDANYAWLSCGPKLVVVNVKTGVNISSWIFRERVSSVSPFPAQPGQIPFLLVGLDNDAIRVKESYGMVCIFDCTISQVLRAIRMPAGVEQLCVVNGGAEWEEISDKRVDNLMEHQGMACVALRNLDHFMVDLRRNSWENQINFPIADETNPAEIDLSDSGNQSSRCRTNRERHAVHNLVNERLERYIGFNREEFESSTLYQETLTTAMICSRKIGCLISGCLGRVIIWQNDGVVRWISPAIDDNLAVSHLALLEPTDDPRPFCYLWVAYQEEHSLLPPVLRMYAMLFERKYSDKGTNLYFNLEGEPSLKFELELEEKSRITNLYPIIRESNQEQTESGNKRGEDNLLLINVEGKTILFDLNQWYKEQMPRFIGECQNVDAIFANYRTKPEVPSSENAHISCSYLPSSLREFPCTSSTSPEEFFFPNSLSLEWAELGNARITFWMSRGMQAQLLREMAMAGPIIMLQPSETYHRCVATGLVPFSSEASFTSDADHQRDALLSLCLEQRWTTFLLKCTKEWSDGSAAYLFPAFIRWGIQRASTIKLTAHRLCIPLFDQSGSSIGETEVKTLRFFSQQMECLCNVVENLPIEASNLEQQRRVLRRISTYLQVLLWFYDVGLLPETQDVDEEILPISFILKIPYPAERLAAIYAEKRQQYRQKAGKKQDNEEDLFIDELITRECPALRSQWEQESGKINYGGHYPPPSLQSLLRSCLTDCYYPDSNEMESKHQIIIYLLMDLVMLLQGSCPGVDQLIKYPSAFKFSPSLIKLTHALWFLDHEDYQGFLDTMTGQLVSESDIKDWHHRLVMRTLLRSHQNKMALIYLRVRKPPLSSIDDQGTAISLSVEHGLVQSAFHRRPPSHYNQLLIRFFRACKAHGKLNDILHLALDTEEEEAFVHFLEGEKCEETRLIYYLQRCRYNEASNVFPSDQSLVSLQRPNRPASLSMFHAYNATLPEITRRFSSNQVRRNLDADPESSYPRPMSHYKSRVRPRELYETVIRKAKETFLRGDSSQIPFISAPCLSLKTSQENVDSNCVLFVERARRSYGKRTRDQMNEDNGMQSDQLEARKRQKTYDKLDSSSTREIGISMTFDTPLVKRKHQLNIGKDNPIETPHSILKIRQMIRDSASPSGKVSSSEEERVPEKEKKPRQIRFSINQPKVDDSIEDVVPLDNEELIEKQDEPYEARESTKSRSVTPTRELPGTGENKYISPNASTVSFEESTVLTDNSSNVSRSLSSPGPRPRPGLKRTNFMISPFVPSKKPLRNDSAATESPIDSANTSADISFTSEVVSSTFMDACTPRLRNPRTSLPSTSIYASTILSPSSSIELSPPSTPSNNKNTLPRTSTLLTTTSVDLPSKHNSPSKDHSEQEKNAVNNISTFSYSEITHKTTVIEEVDIQDEDSRHTEVNEDIQEVFSVESPVKEEYCSVEVEEKIEETQNFVFSTDPHLETIPNEHQQEIEEVHEVDDDDEDEERTSQVVLVDEDEVDIIVEDDTDSMKPSDDLEDELLALKYEEDDDDVFQSLSNSMERDNSQRKSSTERSTMQQDSPKKTVTSLFNEEFNITDDESSTSVCINQLTTEKVSSQVTDKNQEISEATTAVVTLSDDVNITDDETGDSFDSSRFTSDVVRDRNMNERSSTMNEIPSTVSVNNVRAPSCETEESFQPQLYETREQTPKRSISEVIPDEKENQDSTPARMTRSRRASSAMPVTPEPPLESHDAQKIGRTRRASSLVQEVLSPSRVLRTTPSGSDSSAESPVAKRGRARRSTSLMKEVLTTSLLHDQNLGDINELPVRRNTRRAASVQKETPEIVKTPTKNVKSTKSPPSIGENPSEESEPVKKTTRGKRATSVTKEVDVKPRRTRAASVSSDVTDDSTMKNTKPKRTRAASVSKETIQEASSENSGPARRTRAASVTKEIIDDTPVENTSSTRRRRGASVSKESTEEAPPRRTRAASLIKETPDEVTPRKKRAASVTKEDTSSLPRRATRASSLSKETLEEAKISSKRVTRRKASTSKESAADYSRTRKGSLMTEVIPEEVDDDEPIFDVLPRRKTSELTAEAPDNQALSTRVRSSSIAAIPEEDEESSNVAKGKQKKVTRGTEREKRSASVDVPQLELKRRTRRLAKSTTTNDDSDEPDKSSQIEAEDKTTMKATTRRKRATSETKEVGSQKTLTKPRRGSKLSERSDEIDDSYQFSAPDETRGAPTDLLGADEETNFIFSPPVPRSSTTVSSQPRRPVDNFISPITDEERRRGKLFIRKPTVAKQSRRKLSLPGIRTKFVVKPYRHISQ